MFLSAVEERNPQLIEAGFLFHQQGDILPDTYLLDLDMIEENGRILKEKADEENVLLYFMLKQIGRNPEVGKLLMSMGYEGAVCVDFKEALTSIEKGVKVGHVGHLVQTPKRLIPQILKAKPEVITVFSLEKAQEISEIAENMGMVQPLLLRVIEKQDEIYSGQEGGFYLEDFEKVIASIESLPGVQIGGLTTFPAFLYNEKAGDFLPTPNVDTVHKAEQILLEHGYDHLQINLPSGTCVDTLSKISKEGGTHGEVGHALTGTTPYHATHMKAPEKPAYIYVSEISHQLDGKSYCYGGGNYARGHLENVRIGTSLSNSKRAKITPPPADNIDYTFEIEGDFSVSHTAIMAARTQIFVTRSEVAVVHGISKGRPEIIGIYTALGEKVQ